VAASPSRRGAGARPWLGPELLDLRVRSSRYHVVDHVRRRASVGLWWPGGRGGPEASRRTGGHQALHLHLRIDVDHDHGLQAFTRVLGEQRDVHDHHVGGLTLGEDPTVHLGSHRRVDDLVEVLQGIRVGEHHRRTAARSSCRPHDHLRPNRSANAPAPATRRCTSNHRSASTSPPPDGEQRAHRRLPDPMPPVSHGITVTITPVVRTIRPVLSEPRGSPIAGPPVHVGLWWASVAADRPAPAPPARSPDSVDSAGPAPIHADVAVPPPRHRRLIVQGREDLTWENWPERGIVVSLPCARLGPPSIPPRPTVSGCIVIETRPLGLVISPGRGPLLALCLIPP
jgi:hypothetical protein